jgi:glycosyltransferase involved in cell wall biosynthesis
VRVLYVNHTAVMSGAERSLLELIEGLPAEVEPHLACPVGPLADAARALGFPVTDVPGTDGSLKLHPARTAKAVVDLGRATLAVRKAAKRAGADLVHANTARAGLVASAVTRLGGPPAVVHVRDRLPRGVVSDAVLRALVASARIVIANSRYTGERIPIGRAPVRVIPNPVDVESLSRIEINRTSVRTQLGLGLDDLVLVVVGQITPWKGQDLAIRVAAALSDLDRPVRLLIVGSPKFTSAGTRYDNLAYAEHLHRLVESLGVEEGVWFLGEREDVPVILAAADLALAPSWEEPFGRSIVEAMAMGLPVIATEIGGPAEIVDEGVHGVLLPPRRPEVWAHAVRSLIAKPDEMQKMGRLGRERAIARFGVGKHVQAVLDVYRAVVSAPK